MEHPCTGRLYLELLSAPVQYRLIDTGVTRYDKLDMLIQGSGEYRKHKILEVP